MAALHAGVRARGARRDAGPVIEKVVALQDHLGWLHDADVAATSPASSWWRTRASLTEAESAAIGRYLVDRERELARLRRTVGPRLARRLVLASGARSDGVVAGL